MGDTSFTSEIVRDGKTLTLVVVSISGDKPTANIEQTMTKAFSKVAKYLKEARCVSSRIV